MDRSRENLPHSPPDLVLPRAAPGALGGDTFGSALERWAADAAVDEAARTRIRERWLRVQSEESASLIGTLVDLAERAKPVVLDVGDHRVRGVLVGVGGDFVAMRAALAEARGQDVLVRISAIESVRAEPGAAEVHGDRAAMFEVGFDAVVGPLAAERPAVVVRTSRGSAIRGELRSAGRDVLRVRVDGDPPTPVWVPLGAVAMLVIGV